MALEEVNVEQIVQSVLARLRGSQRQQVDASSKLVVRGRLVTEHDLAEQLRAERILCVEVKTVITPSARDYLRDRGIAIEVLEVDRNRPASGDSPNIAVGVAATKFEPGSLLAQLGTQGIRFQQLARVGLVGVVDELTERVAKGGERGLLFTERDAAAVCLANRVRGTRAAAVRAAEEIRQVRNEVGANLLIVNPARATPQAIGQIARCWCAAPLAPCPQELSDRLG